MLYRYCSLISKSLSYSISFGFGHLWREILNFSRRVEWASDALPPWLRTLSTSRCNAPRPTEARLIDEERSFPQSWGVKSLLSESKWEAVAQRISPERLGRTCWLLVNRLGVLMTFRLTTSLGSTVIHQKPSGVISACSFLSRYTTLVFVDQKKSQTIGSKRLPHRSDPANLEHCGAGYMPNLEVCLFGSCPHF